MITEKDLQEAIAECQGERNPNANTCIKLAAYYTILNQMSPPEPVTYSYASEPHAYASLQYASDTEFGRLVSGKNVEDIMAVMDELMTALEVLHKNLYHATIQKISDL